MDRYTTVILRALEPEDIDILYKWENQQKFWQVSNTITPFSKYVLTKYIESSHLDIYQTRQLRLMIDLKDNEGRMKTIGAIDLFDLEPRHNRAGVGILIGETAEQGKGYASDALAELIRYSFGILNLKQLYCNIGVDNLVSISLFKKHGFSEIGVKKCWNKTLDTYSDELMMQCINTVTLK